MASTSKWWSNFGSTVDKVLHTATEIGDKARTVSATVDDIRNNPTKPKSLLDQAQGFLNDAEQSKTIIIVMGIAVLFIIFLLLRKR